MNSKGQVAIYGIMLGVVIIIMGLALAPAGREFTDTAMNQTTLTNITIEVSNETSGSYLVNGTIETIGLDCANESISNFDKGTCIIADFSFFYFFTGLILLGGAVIAARIIFG